MRRYLAIATTLVAALAPAASVAQTTSDDVRCLVLASTFARTAKQPQAQAASQAAAGYYLGRIDGRVPPATLKATLAAQEKALTPANAPALMNACVARMAAANRAVQALAPQGTPVPAKAPTGR